MFPSITIVVMHPAVILNMNAYVRTCVRARVCVRACVSSAEGAEINSMSVQF